MQPKFAILFSLGMCTDVGLLWPQSVPGIPTQCWYKLNSNCHKLPYAVSINLGNNKFDIFEEKHNHLEDTF